MIPLVLSRVVFQSEFVEGQELRALIFFSLICQIILVCLVDRRKYIPNVSIRALTWLAYLMADSVASYALGMITNNVTLIDNQHVSKYLIENITLTTFWAPFLLLHLGGPDRITAYSLEDNELWSRHFLTLFNQTVAIVIIFYIAWNQSRFYKFSMLMMVPALIKYGERVRVLWAASSDHFTSSCPDLEPDHHSRILEEYELKEIEGYKLIPRTVNEVHKVMRTHVEADLKQLSDEELYERSQFELLAARGLVDMFKRIFADLLLSFKEYDTSRSVLMGKNPLVVHRVIEIELGFLYDLLYTKASVIHSRFGLLLRFCSITVTFVVLILFTFTHKNKFLLNSTAFDINLTYALLVVALLLEIYAVCELLSTDWTACWLINHKWFGFLKFINWFRPLHKRRRWSNSIGQYSLLSVSLKEKQSSNWHRVLGFLPLDSLPAVQKYLYQSHEKVSDDLKGFIIEQLIADDRTRDVELPSPWTSRGIHALERNNWSVGLKWSIELEFAESIIVWHIATDICNHLRNPPSLDNSADSERDKDESSLKISKLLSRYMVYLLVMYPKMLPTETTRITYQDTYAAAMKFFEQKTREIHSRFDMATACQHLLDQVKTKDDLTIPNSRRSKSKFLLYNGCRLALQLRDIVNEKERWRVVSEVWIEILAYAASECDTECHARQLRRGGELLTHVWFLMTHFGLTDYFNTKNVPAIVDMIVK